MTEPRTDGDGVNPATAFSLLGSETRLRILSALWESAPAPMTFSKLQVRVGVRDAGQFAYHLNKLVGPYVHKSDEGYGIRMAGVNVVWAMLSGEMTDHPDTERFEVEGGCSRCGGSLEARYEDELLAIECTRCAHLAALAPFPPPGFADRTHEEVLDAFERRLRSAFEQMAHGSCPRCACHGSVTLPTSASDRPSGRSSLEPLTENDAFAVFRCAHCGFWGEEDIGCLLTHHAVVKSFFRDHGVDFDELPSWSRSQYLECETDVRSTDPLSVRVRFFAGDESLVVTADETLSLESVERESAGHSAAGERTD
ncbi:winged helix-turn-helix domain-containing protein [Halogeometricum limi]|uniref:Helix-turn-helix domain-containing protein n=1 Tax=Halogeometricum limi TaxID=555875 RepID=A0A1I6GW86_9EURY|nr:helix-turn-helix domain-containing protein [Halogeometricum limi]SFR46450.1 Helix-turn-helix domain-containing protein [Halogeometricum limi]